MIDLTIVIVSYETEGRLVECLDALEVARGAEPELSFEIIVVDNGSRDGSVRRARAHPVDVRLVAGCVNRGFAAAVNTGLRLRRGRHVLLLNSDVCVTSNLLADGVSLLDGRPDVGVLGPALFHTDGRPQRSVHSIPHWVDELFPSWFRSAPNAREIRGEVGVGTASDLDYKEVDAVRGAVFFIRGEMVDRVGDFDEGYFFFLEETDYCARVRQVGARVAYCSALRATHHSGASSKQRAPLATRIEYHRSLYRFIARRDGAVATWIVRMSRTLRNGVTVLGLALPGVVLPSARRRFAERLGLLLWHLRGCPNSPSLAEVLARKTGASTLAEGVVGGPVGEVSGDPAQPGAGVAGHETRKGAE